MSYRLRCLLTGLIVCLSFGVILGLFWYQDWQYALPTPRPRHLIQPVEGTTLRHASSLAALVNDEDARPLYLHFFNPECPCSRFNLDHVRRLVTLFSSHVRILAIVEGENSRQALQSFRETHLPVEAYFDKDAGIAKACGVYSTPQAVLLSREGKLYYRGNYNAGRYCNDPETEFARRALEALVAGRPLPNFPSVASHAYGCQLPTYQKLKPL